MPLAICLAAILAQQTIIASTTLAIAQAAAVVSSSGNPLPQLIYFCIALLCSNLPDIIIEQERERSKYWLFDRAIQRSTNANFGATSAYFNRNILHEKEPFVDAELWITVSDNVTYLTDLFATLANIILNTIAIAGALSTSFALALLLSGFIALAFSAGSFRLIQSSASHAQSSRAHLFSHVRTCIPNTWIGNGRNFSDWENQYRRSFSNSRKAQSRLSFTRSSLASATTFASSIPFVMTIISFSISHSGNLSALMAFIAILPRQVSTLQYMNVLVSYAAQLSERIARTKLVYSNLTLTEAERGARGVIKWGELKLSTVSESSLNGLHDIEDVEAATRGFAPGRITLRGTNGCGKSTLLAQIKERLGDRAFLLPANPVLYFPQLDGKEASSGQAVSRALDLIEGDYLDDTVTTVLLDEWDANLDDRMRIYHDRRLNELAQRKCIIEVLHNKHQEE